MSPRVWMVHGLVVESDVELPARAVDAPVGPADVTVRRRHRHPIAEGAPPGRTLAMVKNPQHGGPFSTIGQDDDGVTRLRVHGTCELEVSARHDRIDIDEDPTAPPGLAEVILGGSGLALLLILREQLVLHASAVELDGQGLAFLGGSGMGKSTLATLCCAAGARIIADDLLRVDTAEPTPVARRGATHVRLRPGAGELADLFSAPATPTADDRLLVRPAPARSESVPLAAVLVPVKSAAASITIRWQQGAPALLLLEAYPRLLGWVDADAAATQFRLRGDLGARVAVGIVTVPSGPPFDVGVPERLFAALAQNESTNPDAWSVKSSA